MPFKYSCFISYAGFSSPQSLVAKEFIDQLKEALESEISLYVRLPVFLDQERLRGGDLFNEELATSICQSVCMICVFTPNYFDRNRTYCAREFRAMEILERRRLERLGDHNHKGAIIPIILRGSQALPEYIRSKRQFHDFSGFVVSRTRLIRNPNFNRKISDIAAYIYDLYNNNSEDHCRDCHAFQLPAVDEIVPWMNSAKCLPMPHPFPGTQEGL
jgi:hypothetical protein